MCVLIFVVNRPQAPLKTLGAIALLTVATMGFSNTSLSYLNYPTQVADCGALSRCHMVLLPFASAHDRVGGL